MIAYLPELYPDELAYSWFCRYYAHSGYLTHKSALEDILYKRHNNPSKEFLGRLSLDMTEAIKRKHTIEDIILKHTMVPQYARFIPLDQKKNAVFHIGYDFCDAHHLFAILPRHETDAFLKYCPICADEDRQKYGETYWHRAISRMLSDVLKNRNNTLFLETLGLPSDFIIPFSQEEGETSVVYTLKQGFDDKYEITLNGHPCIDHVIHSGDYFAFKNKINGKTVKTLFVATSDIQAGYKKYKLSKDTNIFIGRTPLNDISYDFSDFVSREKHAAIRIDNNGQAFIEDLCTMLIEGFTQHHLREQHRISQSQIFSPHPSPFVETDIRLFQFDVGDVVVSTLDKIQFHN